MLKGIIRVKDNNTNIKYDVPSMFIDETSLKCTIPSSKYEVALDVVIDKWLKEEKIKESISTEINSFCLNNNYYKIEDDDFKQADLKHIQLIKEALDYCDTLDAELIDINDYKDFDNLVKINIKDKEGKVLKTDYLRKDVVDKKLKKMNKSKIEEKLAFDYAKSVAMHKYNCAYIVSGSRNNSIKQGETLNTKEILEVCEMAIDKTYEILNNIDVEIVYK